MRLTHGYTLSWNHRWVLAAIVYLVQAGCPWRKLPAALFGVSRPTVHRRFAEWTADGLRERLHQQFLHRLNVISEERVGIFV